MTRFCEFLKGIIWFMEVLLVTYIFQAVPPRNSVLWLWRIVQSLWNSRLLLYSKDFFRYFDVLNNYINPPCLPHPLQICADKDIPEIILMPQTRKCTPFTNVREQRQSWNHLNATNIANFLKSDFSFSLHFRSIQQ